MNYIYINFNTGYTDKYTTTTVGEAAMEKKRPSGYNSRCFRCPILRLANKIRSTARDDHMSPYNFYRFLANLRLGFADHLFKGTLDFRYPNWRQNYFAIGEEVPVYFSVV